MGAKVYHPRDIQPVKAMYCPGTETKEELIERWPELEGELKVTSSDGVPCILDCTRGRYLGIAAPFYVIQHIMEGRKFYRLLDKYQFERYYNTDGGI